MVSGLYQSCRRSHLAWGRSSCPIFQDRATDLHTLKDFFALLGSTQELVLSENFGDFANLIFMLLQALIKVFSRLRDNQKVTDVDAAE